MSSEATIAKSLDHLASSAIQKAAQKKCEGAKVVAKSDSSIRVTAENRKFTIASSVTSQSLGLAVHKSQRKGSSTVNSTKESDVLTALEQAIELAKFSVPDEYLTLATPKQAPRSKPLDFLYDAKMLKMDQVAIQEIMEEIIDSSFKDSRIALERFEVAVSDSYHNLFNSEDVHQSEVQTSIWWSFMGMARSGEQVSGMDYTGGFSYNVQGLKQKIKHEADQFATKLIRSLDPVKCPEYKGLVLLSPRAVRSLLTSQIMFHASGSQVMDGKSKWIQRVGSQVASPLIHLTDNPHDSRFSGATSFDSDGLPTRTAHIVDGGVLMTHLHSCYTAKRVGTISNAFAGGAFGLSLSGGDTPLKDLMNSASTLLLVDRFSGNTDPLTGDFSGVAKSSRLIRNGQDIGPVHETMIAGNMLELMNQISAVSVETENVGGSFVAPHILLGPVSVS
jgi:PmbA protein